MVTISRKCLAGWVRIAGEEFYCSRIQPVLGLAMKNVACQRES